MGSTTAFATETRYARAMGAISPILFGPAGFAYADWRGPVYPERPGPGFDALAWIGRFFDLLEINVSFYRTPRPERAANWLERAPALRFSAKLPQQLSHERHVDARLVGEHLRFLEPLRAAERFEASLLQFPWSFRPRAETIELLRQLRAALPRELEVCVELRHEEWMPRLAEVVDMGFCLCSIDQPQHRGALGALEPLGDHVSYVRLHGRNAAHWFGESGRDARYDYRYSTDELRPWAQRLVRLASAAPRLRVITNNHFRGSAVANGLELRALLGLAVGEFPAGLGDDFAATLRRAGAEAPIAVEASERADQTELFGES